MLRGHGLSSLLIVVAAYVLTGQSFRAPAGIRPAQRHTDASILPGGRIIAPSANSTSPDAGPFGLAVSANGNTVVTANTGPGRNSLSILERDKRVLAGEPLGGPHPGQWIRMTR